MQALRLLYLIALVAFLLVPVSSEAQIMQIPECGVNLPVSDRFCQFLCRIEDPPPAFCIVEPERTPIVLIPGITVSQNKKLLYKDEEGGVWKFAFGYNVYKGLIKKLETTGYEQGHDLLVAHYDWRNPAAHNASEYLKPIIDQAKQNTGANKVDIIAHSFGGVVTRAYVQSDEYENDIDQLITLGSPHEGAADAYIAWEGGIFPAGWDIFITSRIERVENSLKKARDQKDLRRPESFRAFFPALRDMLPLTDFVAQDGTLIPTTALVEQNNFLKNLHTTLNSIAAKGVRLATIAGINVNTLGQVSISGERTREDEELNRWRDGHPSPEVPPLDSTNGDARVLLSNAHIGSHNVTIPGAVHHQLPDEAQNQVFDILGLDEQPSFFSTFPERMFSVVILSPLEATIEGPNGQLLAENRNDFGADAAEYDDDPADPDDPIEINIADPPAGSYAITYTGTGAGDYTIITTYADADETISSVKDGTTHTGEVFTATIDIGTETTSLIDDADYTKLLEEIIALTKQAHQDKLLPGHEQAALIRLATHARNDLRHYEQRTAQGREDAALARLRSYYQNLNELAHVAEDLGEKDHVASLAAELLQITDKIKHSSPPL